MNLAQLLQVMSVSILLTIVTWLVFRPWVLPALRYLRMLVLGQQLTFKGTRRRQPVQSEVRDEHEVGS